MVPCPSNQSGIGDLAPEDSEPRLKRRAKWYDAWLATLRPATPPLATLPAAYLPPLGSACVPENMACVAALAAENPGDYHEIFQPWRHVDASAAWNSILNDKQLHTSSGNASTDLDGIATMHINTFQYWRMKNNETLSNCSALKGEPP